MILNALDQTSWLNFCLTRKKHYRVGMSENYFKARLLSLHPKSVIMLKPDNVTYKQQLEYRILWTCCI